MDPPPKKSGLLVRAEAMMESGDHYGAYEIFLGQIARARDDEKVRSIAVPGAAEFAAKGQSELCVELVKAAIEKIGVGIAVEICDSLKNEELEYKVLKLVLELHQRGKAITKNDDDLSAAQKRFVKCAVGQKEFGLAESVAAKLGDALSATGYLTAVTQSGIVSKSEVTLLTIRLYLLLLSNGHHKTAKRIATDGTAGVGMPYFLHRSLEQKSVALFDYLIAKLNGFLQKDEVSRKAAEKAREYYFGGGQYAGAVEDSPPLNAAVLNGSVVSTPPPAAAPAPKVSASLDLD